MSEAGRHQRQKRHERESLLHLVVPEILFGVRGTSEF